MRDEKLKELLNQLADATEEPVRPGLNEDIRHHIPLRLMRHRINWNTLNVIIDLRLSRPVAAAVIIIAISLWVTFISGWASPSSIYEDSKLLLKYGLHGENAGRSDILAQLAVLHKELSEQGKDVTFYGQTVDPDNRYAVLMHWKLPDGRYRIILNDLSTTTVSPAALIRLQAYMLKEQAR